MRQETPATRYEPPTIVRRDRIDGLLRDATKSEVKADVQPPSDVRVKANIVPVVWGDETVTYETPAIVDRTAVAGLLDSIKSDVKQPDVQPPSDVRVKANIVPVVWGDETVTYETPAIVDRTAVAGLLDSFKSDVKQPDGFSDVRVKANIRRVVWAGETVAYREPAILDRSPIQGLLVVAKSDVKPDAATGSDVNIKANIVPVRW